MQEGVTAAQGLGFALAERGEDSGLEVEVQGEEAAAQELDVDLTGREGGTSSEVTVQEGEGMLTVERVEDD